MNKRLKPRPEMSRMTSIKISSLQDLATTNGNADIVGGAKVQGLLGIPADWYPRGIVMSFPDASTVYKVSERGEAFSSTVARELRDLRGVGGKVLVRSSAELESLRQRGSYLSVESVANAEDVFAAVDKIFLDSRFEVLNFLVQPMLQVAARGHLSNEYRVSRESVSWTIQFNSGGMSYSDTWRVSSSTPANNEPLNCRTEPELRKRLRGVARRLSEKQMRYHLEWVWDGLRLWIVQADAVAPVPGDAPGDAWRPQTDPVEPRDLALVRPLVLPLVDEDLGGWGKVRAVESFARVGLPVPALWILSGASVMDSLVKGDPPEGLVEDLQALTTGPVVTRTDFRADQPPLMSPKLDSTSSVEEIVAFLREVATSAASAGTDPNDVCFLFHRFIRSRASAWTLATPGNPWVQIDSMWGLPDGLAWLPHDRAWANTETETVTRSVAGKTTFLDVNPDKEWSYRESPTEWIWRASLTEDQVRKMARGARLLADEASSAVLTMWFVELLDGADAEFIPWFQAPHESASAHSKRPPESTKRIWVRTQSDLDAVQSAITVDPNVILRLSPDEELIRDRDFVERVVNIALKIDVPVEIDGSPLAHPYYMLQKAGVPVSCSSDALVQPVVAYNKLVRDDIVEHIEARGEKVEWFRASLVEQGDLLRQKLVEESLEVATADDVPSLSEELADTLEVVEALRLHYGIDEPDLEAVRRRKKARRGAFAKGIVLVSGSDGFAARESEPQMLEGLSVPAGGSPAPVVRRVGDKLVLSLVPPLGVEGREASFVVRGQQIQVEYRNSEIEVRLIGEAVDARGALEPLFVLDEED